MKICIDATPIGIVTVDKGGVCRYIFELIKAISLLDQTNQYTLFFNFFREKSLPIFHDTIKRLRAGENFHVRLSRVPMRLRNIIEPPIELLTGRFDIFHGCFDYLPRILFGQGVVTIHDVRYMENIDNETDAEWIKMLKQFSPSPEFYVKDYLGRSCFFNHLRSTVKKTIQRADRVITVSEFCKSRITELLCIPSEKVKVIHHGVDKHFKPLPPKEVRPVLDKFGVKKPYIFYAGKFDPLKNLIRLLEAFKEITVLHDVNLVMAGIINWFYYILIEKARQLNILNKVVFTDFVTDEELVALYNGASAFALPSIYEGFGIPLLEAMACGVPIVTSNICSIPEVVGDAALFADPYSVTDLSQCILQCLTNETLQEELIEKGKKQVKLFTWENSAKETIAIYKEACEK